MIETGRLRLYPATRQQMEASIAAETCSELKKAYSEESASKALDFLELEGWLSDRRFAEEWLRSRGAHHYEGRSRLIGELRSRGVSKVLAAEAVEQFFKDTPEEKQLEKAYKKLTNQGKEGEKLVNALMRLGFSNKLIKKHCSITIEI